MPIVRDERTSAEKGGKFMMCLAVVIPIGLAGFLVIQPFWYKIREWLPANILNMLN